MTIELRILSGSRAGERERFDNTVVTIGRHPLSDLRFDPQTELEVSTRHAELREIEQHWAVHDPGSTNGTFVNGERVIGSRRVHTGDVVSLGASGPRVELHLDIRSMTAAAGSTTEMEAMSRPAGAPRRDTNVRIAEAVQAETASLKRMAAIAIVAVIVIAIAALMLRRGQSAAESVPQAAERVTSEARVQEAGTPIDIPHVRDLNDSAVALIASDLDGTFMAGTAFAVSAQGELVTNKHVVQTAAGGAPRRIRVLFANTTAWLPAQLVRVSESDDLALIRVDGTGTYPVVAGVSRAASDTRVGSPVATIGYPHAVDTPMEGAGLNVRARTTTTAGTVSKRLGDVLQIDTYAGKGSSGSPVFDAHGSVVGVIYGGESESQGRIVYAVPAERLAAFLGASAIIR